MNISKLLPSSLARMLSPAQRKSNQEMIIEYLVSPPGTVELTEKQRELFERWKLADQLLRAGRYTTKEVAQILAKQSDIATAWRDIDDARYVFGSTRKSNKTYLLQVHVERIEASIMLAKRVGRDDLLPKLYDAYTKAISMLPDDVKENVAPAAIIFNITEHNVTALTPDPLTAQEAENVLNKYLEDNNITLDIDHENLP